MSVVSCVIQVKVFQVVLLVSLVLSAMDPTIDNLLARPELREMIFGYLDPASIKTAALVSR